MNETESLVSPVSQPVLEAVAPQAQEAPAAPVSPDMIAKQMAVEQRHASVLPGLIGALLGSIPGVLLWIIIGQIGYIAGICGFLMVRGAIFGYTKLAGGIDRRGEILSTIVAVFMPLVAEYLGIAVSVYRTFHSVDGTTVADAFASVPLNLADPDIVRGLLINLVIGYVLFAISFIRIKPKESKLEQSKLPRL
jgi:hypothetical protein